MKLDEIGSYSSNLLYNSIAVETVQVQCHANSIQLQAVNPTIPENFEKRYWKLM